MPVIECTMLVDDDTITNFLNEELFKELDVTEKIKLFANGLDALEFIQDNCMTKKCPELILLDINMPVMNGFEFLEAYDKLSFANKEDITIVMLTTSSNSKDYAMAQNFPVKEYLTKPLTEEKLKNLINKYFKH